MLGKYRGKIDCTEEELSEILEEYKGSKLTCPVDEKGWVYGSLINGKTPYIVGEVRESMPHGGIVLDYWYPVKKETIGQFTGLYDKNRTEIYEGDIVKFELGGYQAIGEVVEFCGSFGIVFEELDSDVLENNTYCGDAYCGLYIDYFLSLLEIAWNFESGFDNSFESIEVIGNKYDNPELIKVE